MRTKIIVALSPACLALLLGCSAAPVNEAHQHLDHPNWNGHTGHLYDGGHQRESWNGHQSHTYHDIGATTHHARYPLYHTGPPSHDELSQVFQHSSVESAYPHHSSSARENMIVPHQAHSPSIEPSSSTAPPHQNNDGTLWAIVDESSKRFSNKQTNKEIKQEEKSESSSKGKEEKVRIPSFEKDWRYNLSPGMIAIIHAKYRELVGGKRDYNTLYKRINRYASQQDAFDLLSDNIQVQQAAMNRIGIPRIKANGLRHQFWGTDSKKYTGRLERATGIRRDRLVKKLSRQLTKGMAEKLKSDDPMIFHQGVKEFLKLKDAED